MWLNIISDTNCCWSFSPQLQLKKRACAPSPSGFLCVSDKQPVFPAASSSSKSSALPPPRLGGSASAASSRFAVDQACRELHQFAAQSLSCLFREAFGQDWILKKGVTCYGVQCVNWSSPCQSEINTPPSPARLRFQSYQIVQTDPNSQIPPF